MMPMEMKTRKMCYVLDRATRVRVLYEECTAQEWDNESELTREFINFGDGYTFARKVRR
jgi:hypothetical protein